ncbi:hypothetical protein ACJQWK_01775 [Exserohilum turcicum]
MSYIAQWFREETWDLVNKQGPTAIAAPIAHFKIQSSNKLGAWVVEGLGLSQSTMAMASHETKSRVKISKAVAHSPAGFEDSLEMRNY